MGRKYDKRIFPDSMDTSYLYKTVRSLTMKDLLKESYRFRQAQKEAASA